MDRDQLAAIVADQLDAVVIANRRRRAALDGTGPASTALVAADAIMLAADQYAADVAASTAAAVADTLTAAMRVLNGGPPGAAP